jgi:hypothetical protein
VGRKFTDDPARARRLADKRRSRGIGAVIVGVVLVPIGGGAVVLAAALSGAASILFVVIGMLVVTLAVMALAIAASNLAAEARRYRGADLIYGGVGIVWLLMAASIATAMIVGGPADQSPILAALVALLLPPTLLPLAAETALAGRYARAAGTPATGQASAPPP